MRFGLYLSKISRKKRTHGEEINVFVDPIMITKVDFLHGYISLNVFDLRQIAQSLLIAFKIVITLPEPDFIYLFSS